MPERDAGEDLFLVALKPSLLLADEPYSVNALETEAAIGCIVTGKHRTVQYLFQRNGRGVELVVNQRGATRRYEVSALR